MFKITQGVLRINSRGAVTCPVVLLVDDDQLYRKEITFDFQGNGYHVLHAMDGQEAWEIIQTQAVHVVIADIRIPNRSRIDLIRFIKIKELQLPPVILITGNSELNLSHAKMSGAEAVLRNPVDRKELLSVVRKVVAAQGFDIG